MTTALPNKLCSGDHKATDEESDQGPLEATRHKQTNNADLILHRPDTVWHAGRR